MTPQEIIESEWITDGHVCVIVRISGYIVCRCGTEQVASHICALHNASLKAPLATAQKLRGVELAERC